MAPKADLEEELRRAANEYATKFPVPPYFAQGVIARAEQGAPPVAREGHNWMWQLAAAGAMLLVGIGAAVSIGLSRHGQSRASVAVSQTTIPLLPAQDMVAARLSSAGRYVTPLDIQGHGSADGITLLAAYADPTQIVLFFAGSGGPNASSLSVYDDYGWINSYTRGGAGAPGHTFLVLAAGPHVDRDGRAHITITDTMPPHLSGPQKPAGTRLFSFAITPAPETTLPTPPRVQLGAWQVTIEKLQVTPGDVYLQALINGASPDQVQSTTVTLTDQAGVPVPVLLSGAGVTVPKQQLNASNAMVSRSFWQWERPATAGTYSLRLAANGASQTIALTIPAP